jgi:flagellar biosynthetic protein FlhB
MWQYANHLKKNRMSLKEIQDEAKQSEGDPHFKQMRRQRGYEIAMNKMLSEVPTADVVIVNPTHFAVALKWDRASGAAPVCVAKGQDEIAARIRETAGEAKVPIFSDPPTARAIYATVGLGAQIERDHYRAVAAAIRFAADIRAKARKQQYD